MIFESLIHDGSNSKNLGSEKQLVQEISAYTPSLFAIAHPNESLFSNRDHSRSQIPALRKVWGPPGSQSTDLPFDLVLTPSEMDIYLHNLQHREEEPEDEILVESDILPQLLAQAMQEPPSGDWERHLNEL